MQIVIDLSHGDEDPEDSLQFDVVSFSLQPPGKRIDLYIRLRYRVWSVNQEKKIGEWRHVFRLERTGVGLSGYLHTHVRRSVR